MENKSTRHDGRRADELRPIEITTGFQKYAAGSALIKWGDTWVLCAANLEESVPPFRAESGGGWLTAEYNMLPGSTVGRKRRRTGGRETEIQRLIGRSLRTAFDLDAFGPITITVDCDVIQADGGTRVASITGGYVATVLALKKRIAAGKLASLPVRHHVAAVSVGVVNDTPVLDLPYVEDSRAQVDMNVVMTSEGSLIEVQGTGEGRPFTRAESTALLDLAAAGIDQLCNIQKLAIDG